MRGTSPLTQDAAVDAVVVAAIGEHVPRVQAGTIADTAHDREGVGRRQQLRHVVAVAVGEGHGRRNTTAGGTSRTAGTVSG